MVKRSSASLFPLAKYGRANYAAVFPTLTHKDLGISKSYYNKLSRLIKTSESLPKSFPSTIITKVEKIANKNRQYSVPLYKNSVFGGIIPRTIIDKHTRAKSQHIWVIIECMHRTKKFAQSYTTTKKLFKKSASQQLRDYINIFIKKYDDFPVYITRISFKNI